MKTYTITRESGEMEQIQGRPVRFKSLPGVKFFSHVGDDTLYRISEASTGCAVSPGRYKLRDARKAVNDLIRKKGPEAIKDRIVKRLRQIEQIRKEVASDENNHD